MKRLSASIQGFSVAAALALIAGSSCSESASQMNDGVIKLPATATTPEGRSSEPLSRSAIAASESEPGPLFSAKPPTIAVSAVPSTTTPEAKPGYLVTCVAAIADGSDGAIDNLEDGDLNILSKEKRSGGWFSYEETAGSHTLEVAKVEDGPRGSRYAIHDSAKAHGGWAGFGVAMGECRYDASKYTGVHFWAKGVAQRLRIIANNPTIIPISGGGSCTKDDEGLCYDAHGASLTLEPTWKEYFIPFKDFIQAGWGLAVGPFKPQDLISVEFQLQTENFDIWIDDLGYYKEGVAYYSEPPAATGAPQGSSSAVSVPSMSVTASVSAPAVPVPSLTGLASASATATGAIPTSSVSVTATSSATGVTL